MMINVIPFDRRKIGTDFTVICPYVQWLKLLRISLKIFSEIFSPFKVGPASEWVLGLLELVNPVHVESDKVRSPIIVDTFFLHNIQICVSCPGHVTTFVERSESESWEMCAGASTSVSSGLSVNSSNHSGISRKRSSDSPLPSLFLFWFWVFGRWSTPFSWSWSVTSLQGWICRRQILQCQCRRRIAYQNGRTTREQQAVRNCPICI